MKVAGIQMSCGTDIQANREKAVQMVKMASDGGAKVVGFQEMFCYPWFPSEKKQNQFRLAESEEGPTVNLFRDVAREEGIVAVCPFFEQEDDFYYNTTVVIGPEGEILGKYRKIHLPQVPFWEEKFYFTPGNLGLPVIETPVGAIGIQMSWDNFFPEGARILALKGAQIIFAPTSAAFASHNRWEKVISANAISNNIFIFRVNRVGREKDQHFYGKSFCVNPHGELIAEPAGLKDAIVFAKIDWGEIEKAREIWTFFNDRRPEEYGDLLKV